ncbi:MAG: ABC transporter permease [Deltaproteobacteria bacterium]|nr:ABC transporter permease [Deltaproteobacteria bacterium]
MNFLTGFRLAFQGLKRNKLRTGLTALGIIIGIASVTTMVALGKGAKTSINDQLTDLGSNTLLIKAGVQTRSGVSYDETITTLTDEDAYMLLREVPQINYVSPGIKEVEQVIYKNRNWNTAIVGTSPEFVLINKWSFKNGNYFTDDQVRNLATVSVLGDTVAKELFGERNPVGEVLRIGNIPFTVTGVLNPMGQIPGGRDQDDIVLVPYTTLQKRFLGVPYLENILVSIKDPNIITKTQEQITRILRERHRLRQGEPDDFNIKSRLNIIEKAKNVSKIMTILLGSIASISLIVGGIGIMNTMLVSLGERTREIGIMRSVGATERNMLWQFLIESLLLTLIGGAIGLILGILSSIIFSFITGWASYISFNLMVIAFGFSAAVGIFFGLYPARKASKLNPMEALRYD